MNKKHPSSSSLNSGGGGGGGNLTASSLTIGGTPISSQPPAQSLSSSSAHHTTERTQPPSISHAHSNLPSSRVSTNPDLFVLRSDPSAPQLLANEIRNAKESLESEALLQQRTKYIKEKLDAMTEEQLTRFEFFVRSHFPKNRVKEIMSEALGPKQLVSDEMVIVASGLAKLFVGELCENGEKKMHARDFSLFCLIFSFVATDVMKERKDPKGISPEHIQYDIFVFCFQFYYAYNYIHFFREAYRRMQNNGTIGHRADHHFFFDQSTLTRSHDLLFDEDDDDDEDEQGDEDEDDDDDYQQNMQREVSAVEK
jgi:hypothetical protein